MSISMSWRIMGNLTSPSLNWIGVLAAIWLLRCRLFNRTTSRNNQKEYANVKNRFWNSGNKEEVSHVLTVFRRRDRDARRSCCFSKTFVWFHFLLPWCKRGQNDCGAENNEHLWRQFQESWIWLRCIHSNCVLCYLQSSCSNVCFYSQWSETSPLWTNTYLLFPETIKEHFIKVCRRGSVCDEPPVRHQGASLAQPGQSGARRGAVPLRTV